MNNMKNFLFSAALLFFAITGFSQARIQIIHNSADAALEVVDVWLDQTLLIDNLAFRNASAFMDAPAGVSITIAIKEPGSQNPDNPLWSGNYTLTNGEKYVLVAEGIISSSGYDPATPFDIAVLTGAREIATAEDKTDMMTHHGSTDAPMIDITETAIGLGLLVDNISYAEFDGYQELTTKDFIFDVNEASGTGPLIETYTAYFRILGFKGMAVTMLTSGFIDPAANSNGPEFGLWVATAAGGELIELPPYNPTARVQLIHNSADAATEVVDVWVNETLWIDNFEFRTASPFSDLPADEEITISVTDAGSQNPENPLWSGNYTLALNEKYIMVADGIISASGYDPATPFDIEVFPQAREGANMPENTDLLIHHGSTDAPTVDIYEVGTGAGLLVDNLSYPEFAGYLELEPLDYIIEIRDESGMNKIIAYELPLETIGLDGYAITVVASGFLFPENNSNGAGFGLWMASAEGGNLIELTVYDPKARVQIIHNSADDALDIVDIWLDDNLLLDNFAFRTASPFIDVPAYQEFTIAVKGPDSQDPGNPLWSENYTLEKDEAYILVADGLISTSGYEPLKPFEIAVFPNAREVANGSGQTDMLIHHGSTDTPTVDLVEVGIGLGVMVDDFSYGEFAGYFGMAPVNYILQVRDETGMTKIAAYSIPLATLGLEGQAISVIASGFMVPENNSDGPEFGLYFAKASGGELLKLPLYAPKARIQVINNIADTSIKVVDVWMNQALLLDNFAFRNASQFMDAPANEQFTISIKGPESVDPYNPLYSHNYTLIEGETYILVADGIDSDSGYEPYKDINLAVCEYGQEEADQTDYTDFMVHHGSTDAPIIDVIEVEIGGGLLFNDIAYEDFSSYQGLPAINYIFEVRDAAGETLLGTFRAPFETLGLEGQAITIVASGFLEPGNNSDGPAFGLWAAPASGGEMIELVAYVPLARVQFIHNSADASAAVVDVWLDETLLLDDFAFRTASPFIDAPANSQFTIAIKGSDSQDPDNPLWSQSYTLTEDEKYIFVADGIISPAGYVPAEPFNVFQYEGALEQAAVGTNTSILVFQGSTDAPVVDFIEIAAGEGTIVDNLAYGGFDGYIELETANYVLNVTDEPGTSVLAYFETNLSDLGLDGRSLTLLASGFLDPSVNSDGPAFGLLGVRADGGTVLFNNTLGIDEPAINTSGLTVYPNPAAEFINISFNLKINAGISIKLSDVSGREIKTYELGVKKAGQVNETIRFDGIQPGYYLVTIAAGSEQNTLKLLIP
jgi:hypothetical protein